MPYYDTIKLLILFQYIYELFLLISIMSIICVILNYFNFFQLFHSNQNNWYNSTASPCHTPCCTVPSTPYTFITYRGTIQMPTSWQTTSCIRRRLPASGRRAFPERGCAGAGGAEWFRCHRQELLAVFTGYFQWGWRRELVSCSWARIETENR